METSNGAGQYGCFQLGLILPARLPVSLAEREEMRTVCQSVDRGQLLLSETERGTTSH